MKVEEVTSVETPPRARVGEDVQRRVDYLDGFLKAKAPELVGQRSRAANCTSASSPR